MRAAPRIQPHGKDGGKFRLGGYTIFFKLVKGAWFTFRPARPRKRRRERRGVD